MNKYGEQITGGNYSSLMEKGETVTWSARHLMKQRRLTTKITAFNRPYSFIDEQVTGDFRRMKHEHHFKPIENGTIMIDQFFYELPYGSFGNWMNRIYIGRFMERLLEERNKVIKQTAEGEDWKKYV
jgi:ligand-binding SRPBCC domain-containing protein